MVDKLPCWSECLEIEGDIAKQEVGRSRVRLYVWNSDELDTLIDRTGREA